ncbi:long-chain-fatty-acid--CoA ligase [Thermoflavimicrobium dichotomicum]|uniref:Long-chain acyl-CoA synthetase n=1 Tax=Thermoflavimicrobium dichotomicum TaxID=46223 RepID=A0A1I3SAU5_9BACL|nr:long-chain fatty acid--CoA ligase [Thermoflavimicrobium dichotomicum]SFJ54636.1 long-chain acyl-CoA synthetase [Thermoflavimicrobium dichotomicum]
MTNVTVVDGFSHAKGKEFQYEIMSLPQMLDRTVERHRDKTAVTFYQMELSYEQLQGMTRLVAGALQRLNVGKGDRVGLMLPNCPQYVAAFYGILRRGAIVVQVNPMYTEREIEYVLQDSGADVLFVLADLYPRVKNVGHHLKKVIIVELTPGSSELTENTVSWDSFLDGASPVADEMVDPEQDVAVFQYTGGTTGRSKGAMLTHRNLVANVQQINEHASEDPFSEGDKILTVIPLFHVYGMTCAMNLGILIGINVILLPRFEPLEVLQAIQQHQPTYFPGVPTMYVALNSYPGAEQYGINAIRVCNSGSAPLPVELIQSFEKKTGATMIEGYGLSEASPTTHSTPRKGLRKPGSIGIPLPGTEARIVDLETGTRTLPIGEAGELVIRGPQVMKGYWNMPEETEQTIRDGWLFTGDIARMDEDGYFYIMDRKKDLIIASGYNVYPREIEEVLYTHPAVLEAAVVGVPDAYRGESVKAFVVLKPGASATVEEIEQFCRQNLAAFKIPRQIEFRASLPKTAVGKILRRVLVEEEKRQRSDT